jgi:hypothetical protein
VLLCIPEQRWAAAVPICSIRLSCCAVKGIATLQLSCCRLSLTCNSVLRFCIPKYCCCVAMPLYCWPLLGVAGLRHWLCSASVHWKEC